jgi:PKD repeat protein
MRTLLLLFSTICTCSLLSAQCPVSGIVVPAEVCVESNFLLENGSAAKSFEWDLCPFDLTTSPSVTKVFNTGLASAIDIFFAEDNGRHYGFAIDAGTNSLVRMDFGDNRETIPEKVNLGNVDGLFNFPNSFVLLQENGKWMGIVANGGDNKVLLLDFGATLSNTPVASILYQRGDSGFANIAATSTSPTSHALLIAEFNTRQVIVLDFGDGLLEPFTSRQFVSIPGSSPIDLQLIRYCDVWNAVVVSFENRKLYKLDFGTSFVTAPQILEYPITLPSEPYRLALVREGETHYGFISTTSGGLTRLALGNSLSSVSAVDGLGSFGVLSNSRSLHLQAKDGMWLAYMINFSDGDLYRLSFTASCGASKLYSREASPGYVHYTDGGSKQIALAAIEADGTELTSTYAVEVRNAVASDFSIKQSNSCVTSDIVFEAVDVTGAVTDFSWTFGDGETSLDQAPIHRFQTTGRYQVTLRMKDDNSCINEKSVDAGIFEQPAPQFLQSFPSPACTNQDLEFSNTTAVDPEANVSWTWYVNSIELSHDKDLEHRFITPGPHTVRLVASVPGCGAEVEQNISPLLEGPKVAFAYAGVCAGDITAFTNNTEGETNEYLWDFGDGNTSVAMHPDHTFANYGIYEIQLTASSASGCMNTEVKAVSIGSTPLIDFRALEAPNSCSGVPSLLENLSISEDGNAFSSWTWKFYDPNDPQTSVSEDGIHTFLTPGVYDISLTGMTELGCVSSVDKKVTILPSPSAVYNFTTPCERVPVSFSAPADANIQAWYWEIGTSYYYTSSPSHTFAAAGDYPLYAEFYGANGCVSTVLETVRIPVPLRPDFTVTKNCVGEEAVFTDVSTGADAVATRTWTFPDGASSSALSATHTFTQERAESVKLQLTTISGCSYTVNKQVDIVQPPFSEFSTSTAEGAYPLEVAFANSSANATSFLWDFDDGTSNLSTEESPLHTFFAAREFNVRLTASNPQQCQDTFSQTISAIAPTPDVELETINVLRNPDGSGKLIITIYNKGNTIIRDLPVTLDFEGKLLLQESISTAIFPEGRFNFVFNSSIIDEGSLRYVCAFIDVDNDLVPEDNRSCREFQNALYVFPAYPNPASRQVAFEWMSAPGSTVIVLLRDALGRTIFRDQLTGSSDLNRGTLDVSNLRDGVYFLITNDGVSENIQRIVISGKP